MPDSGPPFDTSKLYRLTFVLRPDPTLFGDVAFCNGDGDPVVRGGDWRQAESIEEVDGAAFEYGVEYPHTPSGTYPFDARENETSRRIHGPLGRPQASRIAAGKPATVVMRREIKPPGEMSWDVASDV